jgi:hypothetical protein
MHLWLNFPASWDLKEASSDKYLAIMSGPGSGPASVPDALVTYGPIGARPDELRAWMEQIAQSDAPAGTRVRLGTAQELVSHAGWPLHLLQADLVDGKGNVLEARLCAFFLFMEHIAVATVRTRDRARQEALSQELLQILASRRPDWRSEPVCLAELWDLESPKPAPPRADARPQPMVDTAELAALLAQVDVELAARPTPREQLRRGQLLLQRPAEALPAFRGGPLR